MKGDLDEIRSAKEDLARAVEKAFHCGLSVQEIVEHAGNVACDAMQAFMLEMGHSYQRPLRVQVSVTAEKERGGQHDR